MVGGSHQVRSIASSIADTLAAWRVAPFPLVTVLRPGAAAGRMLWKTGMPSTSSAVTSAILVIPQRSSDAAARAEQGKPFAREAALARKLAVDKGMQIGNAGVQLLGGHGFVKEHPVERWYRDLRAIGVMEGAVLL